MTRWVHRLWWRIWLATIGAIVVVALLAVAAWRMLFDPMQIAGGTPTLAATAAAALPPAGASADALHRALERARAQGDADFSLFDSSAALLMRVGRPVPPPRLDEDESHWVGWHAPRTPHADDGPPARLPAYALKLADGRWLVARRSARSLRRPVGPGTTLLLLALAVAGGTYPIVRRLTRRLERLQASVERLGGGDLKTRVAVEGRDEVARLAQSFNEAAARIETLVQAHRSLLANASHELRSPLARVRMGIELLQSGRTEIAGEIARDIAELDALIDEILLMSRLDAQGDGEALRARFETVDLTAIVAEESARADVDFAGPAVSVSGDARLLRRLVRNLVENARRYGGAAPIAISLTTQDVTATLEVSDRGPGVAEAERQRIFEPFYRARGASESAGGVGLGLALVRSIARQHGGAVQCLPREGGGSVFRVTIAI